MITQSSRKGMIPRLASLGFGIANTTPGEVKLQPRGGSRQGAALHGGWLSLGVGKAGAASAAPQSLHWLGHCAALAGRHICLHSLALAACWAAKSPPPPLWGEIGHIAAWRRLLASLVPAKEPACSFRLQPSHNAGTVACFL